MKCYCYGQPHAPAYYAMFPSEPVLPAGASVKVEAEPMAQMTLLKVLTAFAASPGKDFGLVCHGSGSGLAIPVHSSTKMTFEDQALVCFHDSFARQMTDEEAANLLWIEVAAFRALKQAIVKVRAKRLDRIVIRACNVGGYPHTLARLREVFGCASICAPTAFDIFGRIRPEIATSEKDWEAWKNKRPGGTVYGNRPNRFALDVEQGLDVRFYSMADSWRAVQDWANSKFPPGRFKEGNLYIHAISPADRLVFPRDSEYTELLQRVG